MGTKISETYRITLDHETERARNHQSQHDYSLEEMGLTKAQLMERYKDVLSEFKYG